MSDPVGGVWAMKSGDFQPANFASTNAGINAAIAYGDEIYIGEGTYTIDTAIAYIAGTSKMIRGAGRGRTILKRGSGSNAVVSGTSTHATTEWYCGLRDVTIDGNNGNGTICSLSGFTLFDMQDVNISNGAQTGLALTSLYDSHFSNVYVENCGDSTHPFVTLDANSPTDTLNNCQFYNLHIEANNQDAILLDILGQGGSSSVLSNYFFGLKLHGNPSTGNPNRPLLRLSANADQNGFWGGEVTYGKGSSQVECSGDRNRFEAQRFGLNPSFPPARAFQFIGGPNSILDAYFINSDSYTTACLRFDSGANNCVVINPFLASGGTPISDAATGTMLIYRDNATGRNKLYSNGSFYFAQAPVLETSRIFATGSGSNGHLVPNAGGTDYSFLLDTLGQSPTFGTATATTNVLSGNLDLSNSSIIRMKDTGGAYRNVLFSSASNLIKINPLAAGQAIRFNNFADNATNVEIAETGGVTIASLTSGKYPIASTGGLLINGPTPLAGTKVYYVSDTSGGAVTRKLTFTDGILTAET